MKNKFTLIELLIVIAIITILVSIIYPLSNKAKEVALRAQCASGLNSIGKTITKYYTSNNGKLPNYDWMDSYAMQDVYICPKDEDPKYMLFNNSNSSFNAWTSFGFNISSTEIFISKIKSSNLILSFDASDLYAEPIQTKSNNGHGNNLGGFDPSNPGKGPKNKSAATSEDIELHGLNTLTNSLLSPDNYDSWYYNNVNFRHLNTANHLLLDGSVEIIKYRVNLNRIYFQQ